MNLVIGSSSQLSHYFPPDYVRISSRDVDFDYLAGTTWDSVYCTFAEQRIYDKGIDYITPNYLYTMKIIEILLDRCRKIVCYTSCELWNQLSGRISISTPPKFYPFDSQYTISKLLLMNRIKELRTIDSRYSKVVLMHPFYFNSIYRSEYFLFGKIMKSILTQQPIQVNSLDHYRDTVHAKFVVEKSIQSQQDTMIGSGKLFNLREFIKDLYNINGLDFRKLVTENSIKTGNEKLIMADVEWDYSYEDLLADTQTEIEQLKHKKGT